MDETLQLMDTYSLACEDRQLLYDLRIRPTDAPAVDSDMSSSSDAFFQRMYALLPDAMQLHDDDSCIRYSLRSHPVSFHRGTDVDTATTRSTLYDSAPDLEQAFDVCLLLTSYRSRGH